MRQALALCQDTGRDVPVGALVVDRSGQVIGSATNQREAYCDPTAHAEVIALSQAGRASGRWRLDGCSLICTLEPCLMCAGAAIAARVDRIVFGAWDAKAGACGSVWDVPRERASLHHPEVVGGVLQTQAADLLAEFFRSKRQRES